ncbi:MAG: DUF202 domain-containing protein [Candidatus Omnitrophica bacterium]|nr:DUF202 domain-containing protein [Candidatus Omnitrophota bacterium]MDE2221550.1 DUF202 domain-containing protein [Candidatus Omnitrophota bacterium]
MNVTDHNTKNASDHMANERTFLSWIRTSIGIIAFGFVIERFALFMKQMTVILGKTTIPIHIQPIGYSNKTGIILVFAGTLMSLLAFIQFKISKKRIDEGSYRPSSLLYLLVTVLVVLVGSFMVIFLSAVS